MSARSACTAPHAPGRHAGAGGGWGHMQSKGLQHVWVLSLPRALWHPPCTRANNSSAHQSACCVLCRSDMEIDVLLHEEKPNMHMHDPPLCHPHSMVSCRPTPARPRRPAHALRAGMQSWLPCKWPGGRRLAQRSAARCAHVRSLPSAAQPCPTPCSTRRFLTRPWKPLLLRRCCRRTWRPACPTWKTRWSRRPEPAAPK